MESTTVYFEAYTTPGSLHFAYLTLACSSELFRRYPMSVIAHQVSQGIARGSAAVRERCTTRVSVAPLKTSFRAIATTQRAAKPRMATVVQASGNGNGSSQRKRSFQPAILPHFSRSRICNTHYCRLLSARDARLGLPHSRLAALTATLAPLPISFAARRASLEDKRALIDKVDCFIFDCDGVIWRGDSVIEGVPETLDFLRSLVSHPPAALPVMTQSSCCSLWPLHPVVLFRLPPIN